MRLTSFDVNFVNLQTKRREDGEGVKRIWVLTLLLMTDEKNRMSSGNSSGEAQVFQMEKNEISGLFLAWCCYAHWKPSLLVVSRWALVKPT